MNRETTEVHNLQYERRDFGCSELESDKNYHLPDVLNFFFTFSVMVFHFNYIVFHYIVSLYDDTFSFLSDYVNTPNYTVIGKSCEFYNKKRGRGFNNNLFITLPTNKFIFFIPC